MEDAIIEGRISASNGDVDELLGYTKELVLNVCHRIVDWFDRDDKFSMQKLQMIITWAADQNIVLHHNLAGRFGIDCPETRLKF
jgi:hypothetical protein